MKEKTKKILKVSAIALGEMALLTLGFAVGACSAKAGSKQQTAITTPVAKSLIQRPKKASNSSLTWVFEENPYFNTNGQFTNLAFHDENNNSYVSITVAYRSLFYGQSSTAISAYTNGTGWANEGLRTITFDISPSQEVLDFIALYASPAEDSDTETPELPEIKEKVVLNSSYDFRRWFGNVDPTTGAIQYKLPTGASLVSVRVGGLTWENLGNERVYNCIEFTLQPFNSSNALVVSDGLAKTAQQLYGDKYNEFCMLSGVYYSYQSGYDGTYTTITDSALPSVDYRDRIYSMPMVSAQLDGTTENINALDIRNCVIPSVYRTFGISQDDGVVFSTNGYSSVTTRQLLGMDFSSVVNYSEGTASAFSLLTQAFGSVAGLLAVQVLPNITLGLLIFLPLIGAVIVLVIKAVKK